MAMRQVARRLAADSVHVDWTACVMVVVADVVIPSVA